ncbi:MAG: hypothetical protein LC105_00075 [Chitinophagales bacterium]|nr:hypothetical protein [Chitinophagales bacterium]MCZ2392242.1 hypothetical protein [Chitinophagales bacterium]
MNDKAPLILTAELHLKPFIGNFKTSYSLSNYIAKEQIAYLRITFLETIFSELEKFEEKQIFHPSNHHNHTKAWMHLLLL